MGADFAVLAWAEADRAPPDDGSAGGYERDGCAWSLLPRDFPPYTTVQRYFYAWRDSGLLQTISRHLVSSARQLEGREASPSAGVLDSQSIKTTESGGIRGFDAGKKIKGRKRHILTDTLGLLGGLVVRSADIQDRDGAVEVLKLRSPSRALAASCLRRWRIWRRETQGPAAQDRLLDPPDHQALRSGAGLRSLATKIGGGTDLRLARPLPQTRKGLRENHRQRPGLDLCRQPQAPHPPHRKVLLSLVEFRVGHSGKSRSISQGCGPSEPSPCVINAVH